MKTNILLLGSNSFAATGLLQKLTLDGFNVDIFARGKEGRSENIVSGDIMDLSANKYLNTSYDIIINFILIKDSDVTENICFAKELIMCCENKKVNHLIHISSISVYPNNLEYVNEESLIEADYNSKGVYAAKKVAVDNYLTSTSNKNLHISYVRPGFILSNDRKPPLTGILKRLPLNFGLLLGNKKTTLPVVEREIFQKSIIKILNLDQHVEVHLILNNSTKYKFIKKAYNYRIITLPKRFILVLANVSLRIGIFSKKQVVQISGLFKTTVFDPSKTETNLKIRF
ncbi:NAD-dependent epimerase/dehydratase family protein [Winogradskyella ludwigii]|uniref:NAD-dependent epimerase/dehydratase family protein n=1 Tax=Winogradskyella ludwigii TaxID=2686076 RepID=UPI0015CA8151|nr:NAD-dependent epimerase/dehydratase family protein [Winogradskyella ludwigii]